MRKGLSWAAGILAALIAAHEILYYLDHRWRSGASLVIAALAVAVLLLAVAVRLRSET